MLKLKVQVWRALPRLLKVKGCGGGGGGGGGGVRGSVVMGN